MGNFTRTTTSVALTFSLGRFVFGFLLFISSTTYAARASRPLCANHQGNFVGLAIDEDAWESIPGKPSNPDDWRFDQREKGDTEPTAQSWKLTKEEPLYGSERKGPRNSYAGHFLQVVPDSGRTYPGRGKHLEQVEELVGASPCLVFRLEVKKEGTGWHTLFVRWTGGDNVGGGDSFFVAMHRTKGKGEKGFVTGQRTLKPAVVPMNSDVTSYAGCCYHYVTHACPCLKEAPVDGDNSTACPSEQHKFIDTASAIKFGVQCLIGKGDMEMVRHPHWYLFAGQEAGDVMDFDSEPWDTTCEAEGSNTRDSGHDFPSWDLTQGEYELRIYAREDGTAIDGIYIVGPDGDAPGMEQRYTEGDSTICYQSSYAAVKTVGVSLLSCLAVGSLFAFALFTETGKDIKHSVEMRLHAILHRNDARESIVQYQQFTQLETTG